MNICRLVHDFPRRKNLNYGLYPNYYHISREQIRLGHNVYIVCTAGTRSELPSSECIDGIKVRRVKSPYNINATREMDRICKQEPIELIHAHATTCFLFPILRRGIKRLKRQTYVVHVHGTTLGLEEACKAHVHMKVGSWAVDLYRRETAVIRQRIMWTNAEKMVAVSHKVLDELVRLYGISQDRIFVVPNGVDLDIFRPKIGNQEKIKEDLGMSPEEPLVLYLGGYRPVKGPQTLIESLLELIEFDSRLKVLFVGNPDNPQEKPFSRDILNFISQKRVQDAIIFKKNIPHQRLPDYYSACDVVIVPSFYEGFPKVVLEAMACGSPVIGASVGAIPDIIEDGQTGFLFLPGSPSQLAERIIEVLQNRRKAEVVGKRASRLVSEKYSWTKVALAIERVYKENS